MQSVFKIGDRLYYVYDGYIRRFGHLRNLRKKKEKERPTKIFDSFCVSKLIFDFFFALIYYINKWGIPNRPQVLQAKRLITFFSRLRFSCLLECCNRVAAMLALVAL